MLEELPGVASADADKTTRSATIIYDKSIFDTSSIGDQGRYQFELREDSAAEEETDSAGEAQASDETEDDSSLIKIEDAPAEDSSSASEDNGDDTIMPSLDGPTS